MPAKKPRGRPKGPPTCQIRTTVSQRELLMALRKDAEPVHAVLERILDAYILRRPKLLKRLQKHSLR